MRPERGAASNLTDHASVERLTATLLTIAADQDVRVFEALAATLVNASDQPGLDGEFGLGEPKPPGFVGHGTAGDVERKLELGRRVARRALRGSLVDPTSGATAFHRIEANPVWARDLLPVAVIGSFLFYKLQGAKMSCHGFCIAVHADRAIASREADQWIQRLAVAG